MAPAPATIFFPSTENVISPSRIQNVSSSCACMCSGGPAFGWQMYSVSERSPPDSAATSFRIEISPPGPGILGPTPGATNLGCELMGGAYGIIQPPETSSQWPDTGLLGVPLYTRSNPSIIASTEN